MSNKNEVKPLEQIAVITSALRFQGISSMKITWNRFRKLKETERYKWLAKETPRCTPMMNRNADEFFYPNLGGVIVHLNESQIQYKTVDEAVGVAKIIKEHLQSIGA